MASFEMPNVVVIDESQKTVVHYRATSDNITQAHPIFQLKCARLSGSDCLAGSVAMKRPSPVLYLLLAFVALTPVGLRVMTWSKSSPHPVDSDMAQAGGVLFEHEWTAGDPLCGGGDGLGPVFNATSCVACHNQGGVGGSGGLGTNVTTFTVRSETDPTSVHEGVVHAHTFGTPETLANVHPGLPAISRPAPSTLLVGRTSCQVVRPFPNVPQTVQISQRNTPALFGASLIDGIPDRVIVARERSERMKWGMASSDSEDVPVGRAVRMADGRIGRFGWKAQIGSLSEFVQTACANELGLGNPEHPQPTPMTQPGYQAPGLDLTLEQCDQLTAFIASLPRPTERSADAQPGKRLFAEIGCAECHTPDLGDVTGIYSDLLLHQMGQTLVGGGSYGEPPPEVPKFKSGKGPQASEWRTPPLWGVADSAPYLHDGRATTLMDAIVLHGGQGTRAAKRFSQLNGGEQGQLIAFLKTLRAP
jgi:CxxC motif-containing protein (DUF1111 family)